MDISYKTNKLKKAFEEKNEAEKTWGKKASKLWGPENAQKLMQRHSELKAANNLGDFCKLPAPHCHPLSGNRDGQFSCDGKHPHRLIFEVDHDQIPRLKDGGIDLKEVTHIRIIEVVDYHGK